MNWGGGGGGLLVSEIRDHTSLYFYSNSISVLKTREVFSVSLGGGTATNATPVHHDFDRAHYILSNIGASLI